MKSGKRTLLLSAVLLLLLIGVLAVVVFYPTDEETGKPPDSTPAATSTQAASSEEKQTPDKRDPNLPVIPSGNTEQSRQLATAAAKVRELIRQRDAVQTRSDLHTINLTIKDHSNTLVDGEAAAIPALNALLRDPRVDVRQRAISILGKIRKPCTVEPLCQTILLGKTTGERTAALTCLAHLRPDRSMDKETLLARTRKARETALMDPDLDVRKAAEQAQWALTHELAGYQADDSEAKRRAALRELFDRDPTARE